jgi:hypothetical protein
MLLLFCCEVCESVNLLHSLQSRSRGFNLMLLKFNGREGKVPKCCDLYFELEHNCELLLVPFKHVFLCFYNLL